MNGIHDLGGRDGFGPVVVEENEPIFHAEWEKAAFTMFSALFAAGVMNLDEFRFAIEKMPPVEYLTHPYYAHWIFSFMDSTTSAGIVDIEEFDRRVEYFETNPDAALPDVTNPDLVTTIETVVTKGGSARRPTVNDPKFAVGDRVRVNDDAPLGHTRRPNYIRGRTGDIVLAHGGFIYPDSAASGQGDNPQHVYTVRFESTTLYGATGDPHASVYIDTWEPYLTAA